MMSKLEDVPIIDVHKDNFRETWPSLLLAIKTSTFIAIDTELSGLGNRKLLMSKSIEDRYQGMCHSAKSRSILSLGISCFKLCGVNKTCDSTEDAPNQENRCEWDFIAQTYNIATLCEEEYVVEPASLQFLVEHGFDFNRQYAKGVPYYRGSDKTDEGKQMTLRGLFTEIVKAKVAVAFHNALMDLMFLYQNLWAPLPSSSQTFLADLTELYPAGIFDTKFVTDYEHKMPASYLEYVFRKCIRTNSQKQSVSLIRFPNYPGGQSNISYCNCRSKSTPLLASLECEGIEKIRRTLCESFAGHGWCSRGNSCPKSHDIDLILDLDQVVQSKKSRKRKRRKQNDTKTDIDKTHVEEGEEPNVAAMSISGDEECASDAKVSKIDTGIETVAAETLDVSTDDSQSKSVSGRHRAGFDSFMTGYIMATYIAEYSDYKDSLHIEQLGLDKLKNSIYLSGKDYALTVSKSGFTKTSKEHREKLAKLQSPD